MINKHILRDDMCLMKKSKAFALAILDIVISKTKDFDAVEFKKNFIEGKYLNKINQ